MVTSLSSSFINNFTYLFLTFDLQAVQDTKLSFTKKIKSFFWMKLFLLNILLKYLKGFCEIRYLSVISEFYYSFFNAFLIFFFQDELIRTYKKESLPRIQSYSNSKVYTCYFVFHRLPIRVYCLMSLLFEYINDRFNDFLSRQFHQQRMVLLVLEVHILFQHQVLKDIYQKKFCSL